MRPCVVQRVSSGTHASREAEHHSKTTRVQGNLPRAQNPKMWKQFGVLCMRIVGEPLSTIVNVSYGTVQTIPTCDSPELWRAGNWLLYDDNAPSHRALATCEFLTHNSITTCPHPPYSPDLAPCDFFLFPKMKLKLKGRRFDGLEEIQRESQNVLGTLREQDFQHAFQQWQWRCDRCVAAQEDCIEGDAAQT